VTGTWIGRVFGSGTTGGNHAAVVTEVETGLREQASELGFRNVTFVGRREERHVYLRTFTPREELPLCVSASIATPVALGAQPGEAWTIEHRGGVLDVSVEGTAAAPVCWITSPSTAEIRPPAALPDWFPPHRGVWRLGQARSRLYAHIEDPDGFTLPALADLRRLCADNDCRGVVFFGGDGPIVRSREFALLDAGELVATGGAALGIGLLLRDEGRTDELEIVQGPPDSTAHGHLLLRFDEHGPQVGGQVFPLVQGRLLTAGT